MLKIVVLGSVLSVALADLVHPVNEDIVREIRQKATTWTPMDPAKNPLSKLSAEEVYGLSGSDPNEVPGNAIY